MSAQPERLRDRSRPRDIISCRFSGAILKIKKEIRGIETRADGRRAFPKEFKIQQLVRVAAGELSQRDLAEELDLTEQQVSRWNKKWGEVARRVADFEFRARKAWQYHKHKAREAGWEVEIDEDYVRYLEGRVAHLQFELAQMKSEEEESK